MPRPLAIAVYLIFFVSGVCGLVYEVIWGKYLSLFIGNTTHAHMIVLATFMGGLAGGSFLFGRFADRVARPLKLYAFLEIGIGLYGVVYSHLMEYVRESYFSVSSGFEPGGVIPIVLKLLLAFLTLILPTCLMGGTLPVFSRFFVRSSDAIGRRVALLYFLNSFGAVAGTLFAGFYVVDRLGLVSGLVATGIVNVAAGVLVWVIDRAGQRENTPTVSMETASPVFVYDPRFVRLALICIFLSGFTSMIYELAWFRVFSVVLESSTYSFSLMLAAFISGITFGSLIAGRIMAVSGRALLLFGLAEMGIVMSVVLAMPIYERLPYYFWSIRHLLNPVSASFFYYNLSKFATCFVIMLIPTLFFGMTLPLVSHLASTGMGRLAEKIGNVYAVNTVGTLLGALCAGTILIPFVGAEHSLEIAFLLNLLIAVAVLWQTPDRPSDRWRTVPVGILVGVMAIYALLIPSWNPARFALGVFRNREAPPASLEAYARESVKKEEVVYFQEDLSATVAVLRQTNAEKKTRLSLAVNGKVDASSDTDRPTQLLLAQLPLMLKDRANDVLIIGLGSGMTAGSALTHPVRQVDCIEISPGVAEAARLFGPYNRNALDNPRLRLIVEDAKTYINTTRQQYDIVIIEPSNPWMAGIGNLYSIEFFRDMAQTLKPDGLVVQWFHTYEVSDEVVATAVRTFREVFPYLYIFQGNATDILMVGAQTRIAPDFGRMAEKFALPAVKEELESIGMYDVADLRSFQMISPENVPKITAIGAINTDYRPIIEYRAPLAFFTNAFSNRINEFDERYTQGESLLLHAYLRNHPLDATRLKRLAELFQTRHTGREAIVYPLMSAYLSLVPEDRKIKQTFAEWSLKRKNYGEALRLYRETFDETDARSLESYAEMHYDAQRALHTVFTPQTFDSTFVYLYKALARAPSDEACLLKLGRAALVVGRYEEAFNCFMLALANRKNKLETPDGVAIDEIITQIARAHYHRGNYEAAREHFVGALRENPTNDMATHYFLMTDQMASFREWEKR